MNLSACRKQIAQGVLPAESGAHKRQIAGAIPTQLSQIALILASKSATFYVFYLLPKTFSGKNFSRADLAGAHKRNTQRNDVILGVLIFFRPSGGSVNSCGWLHRPDMAAWFELTSKSLLYSSRLFN